MFTQGPAFFGGVGGGPPVSGPYFDVVLWTGDGGSSRAIPTLDLSSGGVVEIHSRSAAQAGITIYSRDGSSPYSMVVNTQPAAPAACTFSGSGFTLTSSAYNVSGRTYVARVWRVGDDAVNIVRYAGNSTNRTVAHGLNAVPKRYSIFVEGGTSSTGHTYIAPATANNAGKAYFVDAVGGSSLWLNTAPTSSVFTLSNDAAINNSSYNYSAILFGELGGDWVHGTYTGNGSATGPTINCGFDPWYLEIKTINSSFGSKWRWLDQVRSPGFTGNDATINMNDTNAEGSSAQIALTGTGFQVVTTDLALNNNTFTYYYFAIKQP